MKGVIGDKYIYVTYYVHLVGIKRRNWLQECTELKASKLRMGSLSCVFFIASCLIKYPPQAVKSCRGWRYGPLLS